MEAAWVGEAETLARLRRFDEAITRLETGLKLMPSSGRIAHGLARLLAACPDPVLRDGERAVELASLVGARADPRELPGRTAVPATGAR